MKMIVMKHKKKELEKNIEMCIALHEYGPSDEFK